MRYNKKGLSEVVAVVIVILLVISAGAVVWSVVNNLIKNKTSQISSCFDADFSESIFFNNDYTCYNSSSGEMQFSLGIGDVDIEKAIVSVAYGGGSKTFTITNTDETISDLVSYPARSITNSLPLKNGGKTYIALGITTNPDWVKVVPYVDGKQCEQTDTVYNPYDCAEFIQ